MVRLLVSLPDSLFIPGDWFPLVELKLPELAEGDVYDIEGLKELVGVPLQLHCLDKKSNVAYLMTPEGLKIQAQADWVILSK